MASIVEFLVLRHGDLVIVERGAPNNELVERIFSLLERCGLARARHHEPLHFIARHAAPTGRHLALCVQELADGAVRFL